MSQHRLDAVRPLDDSERDWSTLHIYAFPYRNQRPRRTITEGQVSPSMEPAAGHVEQQVSIPRPSSIEEAGAWPQLFVLPSPKRWVEEAVVEMDAFPSDDVAAVAVNVDEDQQQHEKWAPLHIPSPIQVSTAQATNKGSGPSTFRFSSASTNHSASPAAAPGK